MSQTKFVDVLHEFGITVVTLDSRIERQWEAQGQVMFESCSQQP